MVLKATFHLDSRKPSSSFVIDQIKTHKAKQSQSNEINNIANILRDFMSELSAQQDVSDLLFVIFIKNIVGNRCQSNPACSNNKAPLVLLVD